MATTSPVNLPTGQGNTHRSDAPEWGFHIAVAYLTWALASIVYGATVATRRVNVWEERFATTHPRAFVLAPVGVALGILGVVVAAL